MVGLPVHDAPPEPPDNVQLVGTLENPVDPAVRVMLPDGTPLEMLMVPVAVPPPLAAVSAQAPVPVSAPPDTDEYVKLPPRPLVDSVMVVVASAREETSSPLSLSTMVGAFELLMVAIACEEYGVFTLENWSGPR